MEKQNKTNTDENNLTETIKAVMKDNYSEKQTQDFTLWVDSILIKEQNEVYL